MKIHLTLKSNNAKTGPIPVSMSPASTCPDSCPLKAKGCYASSGPISWHWRKVNRIGMSWRQFLRSIKSLPPGTYWRHNQAGDLPGSGDAIDKRMMMDLIDANESRRGWTYTHKPVVGYEPHVRWNAKLISLANLSGFTVNLSADSLSEADELHAQRIGPVVVTVPSGCPEKFITPDGRRGIVCPAQTRDGITCADCRLCARADRSIIIGFRAHGNFTKAVDARLNAESEVGV